MSGRYRIRVRHLVSPFDVTSSPVPEPDRQWTWCGRLLYHVEPIPKRGPVCKVCVRALERAQRSKPMIGAMQ